MATPIPEALLGRFLHTVALVTASNSSFGGGLLCSKDPTTHSCLETLSKGAWERREWLMGQCIGTQSWPCLGLQAEGHTHTRKGEYSQDLPPGCQGMASWQGSGCTPAHGGPGREWPGAAQFREVRCVSAHLKNLEGLARKGLVLGKRTLPGTADC